MLPLPPACRKLPASPPSKPLTSILGPFWKKWQIRSLLGEPTWLGPALHPGTGDRTQSLLSFLAAFSRHGSATGPCLWTLQTAKHSRAWFCPGFSMLAVGSLFAWDKHYHLVFCVPGLVRVGSSCFIWCSFPLRADSLDVPYSFDKHLLRTCHMSVVAVCLPKFSEVAGFWVNSSPLSSSYSGSLVYLDFRSL